jgi:hypothetical protein
LDLLTKTINGAGCHDLESPLLEVLVLEGQHPNEDDLVDKSKGTQNE